MKKTVSFVLENSFSEQCFQQLQREIVQGILLPGEKLKVIPIAQRFGIGQSPVREALSKLSASGLVCVQENKGFAVAAISESDIYDTYKVFTAIEIIALQWSIEKGDAQWQANIVAALYKLSLLENSIQEIPVDIWLEHNYNFHIALIAGCQSPILLEMRKNIYMKFDRYCQLSYQLAGVMKHNNYACHKQLADAVLHRDMSLACKLMTHHINDPLDEVVGLCKQYNIF